MVEHKYIELVIHSDEIPPIHPKFLAELKKRPKSSRGGFAAYIDADILELLSGKATMLQQSLTISNYRTTDSKSMLNFD